MAGLSPPDTFFLRKIEYERQEHVTIYLAGGLGGLAILGAGDLGREIFAGDPRALSASFITLSLLCAACLGRGFIGFNIAKHDLDRFVRVHDVDWNAAFPSRECRPNELRSPDVPHTFLRIATVLLVANAAVLGVAAWV